MDTVTFGSQVPVSNLVVTMFAVISLICYLLVYFIVDEVFHWHKPIVYTITAIGGLCLAIIVNFIVYILMLSII